MIGRESVDAGTAVRPSCSPILIGERGKKKAGEKL